MPAVEMDMMSYELEATLNRALDQVLMEQVADPLPRLLEVLRSDVPPHVSLAGIQKQLEQLKTQLKLVQANFGLSLLLSKEIVMLFFVLNFSRTIIFRLLITNNVRL
jgi:hypothetical protein